MERKPKSSALAWLLNLPLPGAGFLYVGHNTWAIVAFLAGTAVISGWGLRGWLVWVGVASLVAITSAVKRRHYQAQH
jgi:TM2 domain-containing membrane protein YozV